MKLVPSLRAALWLWYRGTHFRGWQRQSQSPTVQETVEATLRSAGISAGLAAAGRTDKGVHARQQVASVRVPLGTDVPALVDVLQGEGWGCAAATLAPAGFHAQWTPSSKEYRYRLCFGEVPKEWSRYAWELRRDPRLQGAEVSPDTLVQVLLEARGTRDFSAFHAASSPRRPRTLSQVEVGRGVEGAVWELRLRGNGFGRYQVRALLGGAALVAAGRLTEAAWRAALRDAVHFEGMLAPPQGLTLWSLDYDSLEPFHGETRPRLPEGPPFDGLG